MGKTCGDVREIVQTFLVFNKYNGLYSTNHCCACENKDLMPCEDYVATCMPGVYGPCDPQTCNADGDCDWHIQPREDDDGL